MRETLKHFKIYMTQYGTSEKENLSGALLCAA